MNHEADEGEGVVVEHDAAGVANGFTQASENHSAHEAPASPSETEIPMGKADQDKQTEKGGISSQRRSEAVDAPFGGTVIQRTVCVGTNGLDARRMKFRHCWAILATSLCFGAGSEKLDPLWSKELTL